MKGSPMQRNFNIGTSPAKDKNPHTGLNPPHPESHPKQVKKAGTGLGRYRVITKDRKGKIDTSYVKPEEITLEEFYK